MLDRPPRETETLSWIYVILWTALIFVTVPFVRIGVDFVRNQWGREVFTYGVAAVVVLVTGAVLVATWRRRFRTSYSWILGLSGLVIYLTFELSEGSPEEAVHYLQYGILSVLFYRAFAHRVHDYSIYAVATIAGSFVGIVDETIQWITPGRQFGVRDIWLNFTAVGLIQIGLAAGVRPHFVSGWPEWKSLRRLSYLAAVAVAFLGLCHVNTPDRIAWYTERYPFLGFIDPNRSIMVEYGYLHGESAPIKFRSRLTVAELRQLARERAEEGANILDQYRDRERYPEFLEVYSPLTDPFLHEARVHLFRRDVHLDRATNAEEDDRGRNFATAYWENRILEDYFGELLRASSYHWSGELRAEVESKAQTDRPYDSWVSRHLIVAFSREELAWIFLGAVGTLLLMGGYCGIRSVGQGAFPRRADAPCVGQAGQPRKASRQQVSR